jgi:RNA polymerase sigma-70 factor, ECF subfamily
VVDSFSVSSPPSNTPPASFVSETVIAQVMVSTLPIDAAGTGSEAAADRLATLFDLHHPRLFRLARRLSRDAEEARDLVQETFLRAARSPGSIPAGSAAEAWLVRVLVNIQRDEWRRRSVKRRLDPEGEAHAARPVAPDSETTFVAKTTIWRALERLAPRRRAVIVMYELEGTAIPAIAKLLGVSAVTVRWHLSRGRQELAVAITRAEAGGQGSGVRGQT